MIRRKPSTGASRLDGFDPIFVLSVILLMAFGTYAIFSVSSVPDPEVNFRKYLLAIAIGLVPLSAFLLTPYQLWQRFSNLIYGLNIVLLLAVLIMGERDGGAVRWLDIGPIQFQPSEFSKLATVLTLSEFYHRRLDRANQFGTFALSFLHILPTLVLLIEQPHFGATVAVLVTWLSISLIAHVPWKFILITFAAVSSLFVFALKTDFLLHDYHRQRIASAIAGNDQDTRYQQLRSEIAFGVGGISGSGVLKGEQKRMKSVPEQESDFILSVVGEEFGFVGCMALLGCYGLFFIRGWLLCMRLSDPWPRMVSIGILTMLAFHMMINIQMVLGIGPVVGLWLPFISWGGTALWLCMASVGLLIHFQSRNTEALFSDGKWALAANERMN